MVFLSLQRYFMLQDSLRMKLLRKTHLIKALLLSLVFGLFWSAAPLVGFSYYSLDSSLISCSIEWKERNTCVIIYNLALFFFVFFIPFCMIIFTNTMSILIVINFSILNHKIQGKVLFTLYFIS